MGRYSNAKPNWSTNNKVILRNPTNKAFDFHEIVKTMIVLSLRKRQELRNSEKVQIETERPCEDHIADVWMRDKKADIYVWEVQDKVNKHWQEKVEKDYLDQGVTPIVVELKEIKRRWEERVKNNFVLNNRMDLIDDLRVVVEEALGL